MVRGILNRMVMKNLKDEAKNMILKDGLIDYFYVHILIFENLNIQIIAAMTSHHINVNKYHPLCNRHQ